MFDDVDTVPEVMVVAEKNKTSLQKSDDLESESVKSDAFWMMLNWFRQAKRAASLWWADPNGPGMEFQLEDLNRRGDLEPRKS